MARATSYLALIVAYLATLMYIAAMCTPWWYTKYYLPDGDDDNNGNLDNSDTFFGANPNLNSDSRLFSRSNCFIDGSCITGHTIYKNNGNAQWVYTTTLVLMIVGWIPWLIFVHLLHFRANKNRASMPGRRALMIITALLTMALILAAIIVFAVGIVQSNGVYRSGGLYGSHASDGFFGSLPDGEFNNGNNNGNNNNGNNNGNHYGALTAGLPLSCYAYPNSGNNNNNGNNGNNYWFNNCHQINGTAGYKWGAHAAWYFAIVAFALIPLALLLGLMIKAKETVVQTTRTVERSVTTQPAVIPQPMVQQQYVGQNPQYTFSQAV